LSVAPLMEGNLWHKVSARIVFKKADKILKRKQANFKDTDNTSIYYHSRAVSDRVSKVIRESIA